jgi:hypothetical protein
MALAATADRAAHSATTAPDSAPRCATDGLVIWLDTQASRAAGSTYYKLELTNLSGHACTLLGYPGVSAVDLNGHQLGSAASRNSAHPARLVTLASGATAVAVLQIVDAHNFPGATCRPATAAGPRVYPPGQIVAKRGSLSHSLVLTRRAPLPERGSDTEHISPQSHRLYSREAKCFRA